MNLSTLTGWLSYIASLHSFEIDLGLERVQIAAKNLGLLNPTCPVIIVGGTNGKGSTAAGLEAIYRAAGFKVGVYTSPYLFRYNEQIRIEGLEVTDVALCSAFSAVEAHRGVIALTPFEFSTLAALWLFKKASLEVLILEVGLGGRLDAVNILEADVSIITSIGIDHVEWLGASREEVALEKAGIYRANKPAVCGDPNPPASLLDYVARHKLAFFCQGLAFHYQENEHSWSFTYQNTHYENLPLNTLATQNMATALMAVTLLQSSLPVKRDAIEKGLRNVNLPARIQIVKGPVIKIYDVSHNPDAVAFLAKHLRKFPCTGKTIAVFSMLADKDIAESIKAIRDLITIWHTAVLPVKRGASEEKLKQAFQAASVEKVLFFPTIHEAYASAEKSAVAGDRIIIFGSFHTVADVLKGMN